MEQKTYFNLFCKRFPQDKAFQRYVKKHCCPHWFFNIPFNKDCFTDICAHCWDREFTHIPDDL